MHAHYQSADHGTSSEAAAAEKVLRRAHGKYVPQGKKITLSGHGLSGAVAAHMQLKHGDKIAHTTVFNPALSPHDKKLKQIGK